MGKVSLRFPVMVFLVGFGLSWASGIVVAATSELGPRGWTCTSSPCLISSVFYGAGSILMIISGLRILSRILASTVKAQGSAFEPLRAIGPSPDEKEILWLANELLPSFNFRRRRSVQTIQWAEQRWYWGHFSRKGLRGPATLVLPSALRGRLGSDIWKTLLMYYFLQNKPRLKYFFEIILRLIWPFVPVILASSLVSFAYGPSGGLLFGAILGPPLLVLLVLHLSSAGRKIFLREDSRIAKTIGVQKLAECFRAIDQLQLSDVENGKRRTRWIARLWPMPNITQRISNLEREAQSK